MTLWAAMAGWVLVACLALQVARLAHRLHLVAEADHELRGPVSALALAVESLGRCPELSRRAEALDTHLDRLRLGLADLAVARSGRRAAPRRVDVALEGLARATAEAWQPAARRCGGESRSTGARGTWLPAQTGADCRRPSATSSPMRSSTEAAVSSCKPSASALECASPSVIRGRSLAAGPKSGPPASRRRRAVAIADVAW